MKSKIASYSLFALAATLVGAGTLLAEPAAAFRIDFDEGLAGTAGDGTLITDQYRDDYGVSFSTNGPHGLVLYDTECILPDPDDEDKFINECTGQDEDLATGRGRYGDYDYDTPLQGNALIIQENDDDDPDDRARGGKIHIDFDVDSKFESGVTFEKFGFLDLDLTELKNGKDLSFVFEYLDSNKNPFSIDIARLINEEYVTETILSEDWDGNELGGDNSLREYFFNNEDGTFDGLERVTVNYEGISGAVAYMEYKSTQPELPPAEKVPEPAAAFGLLTVGVIGALKRKADR